MTLASPRMIDPDEGKSIWWSAAARRKTRSYRRHLFEIVSDCHGQQLFKSRFSDICRLPCVMTAGQVVSSAGQRIEIEAMLTIHTLDLRLLCEINFHSSGRKHRQQAQLRDGMFWARLYCYKGSIRSVFRPVGLLVLISWLRVPVVIEFLNKLVPRSAIHHRPQEFVGIDTCGRS
jgi:hypothetical protein